MSIKIEITAASIPEMADKLSALAASFSGSTAVSTGTVAVGEPAPAAKPSRSRKPVETTSSAGSGTTANTSGDATSGTAETTTETTTTSPAGASPSEEAVAPATLDFDKDVAPVVIAAVTKLGKPRVEEILSEFGVARASQLDDGQFPELVASLNDAMAA